MTLSCIVIPTDFSTWAKRALERVAWLPLGARTRVHLVHVAPKGDGTTADLVKQLDRVADQLNGMCLANGHTGLQIETHFCRGEPWVEIVRQSRALQADLIVLGRKGAGRGVKQVLGRTAAKVSLRSEMPVLVVGPVPRGPFRRPLLALQLDSSVVAQVALLSSLTVSVKSVVAVHAYHVPYEGLIGAGTAREPSLYSRQVRTGVARSVREFLRSLPATDIRLVPRLVQDMPASAVLRSARATGADLICTGTHGRQGIAHALLGSVAESVIVGADRDVVVARPVRHTLEVY
jgi:nucleotide-binding universal stress UspA family protein